MMRLKRYLWIPVALLPALVVISIARAGGESAAVARGRYLVTVGVCADCHTPKQMGPAGPEMVAEIIAAAGEGARRYAEAGIDCSVGAKLATNPTGKPKRTAS